MTDDDFDDNEFEDEFDFVDEEDIASDNSVPGEQPAANSPSPQKPGGSRIGIIAISAVVVLVGSYYGFNMLSSSTAPDKTPSTIETAKAPVAPKDPVSKDAASLPMPPVEQESIAIVESSEPDGIDDMAVDFADAFGPTDQPQLSEALPKPKQAQRTATIQPGQTKTFEQVQQELQPGKMQVPEEINAALDSISEEMTLNVKQIKQLETMITTMASSIDQLNRTISAMDNRVLSLTETVDALSQDLTNVKKIIIEEDLDLTAPATVKFTSKKQTEALSSSTPSYTVHAIIPGRAWLKSSSGQVITVREGDKVGDYGTVAVIDASNGLVRTSSGITFR